MVLPFLRDFLRRYFDRFVIARFVSISSSNERSAEALHRGQTIYLPNPQSEGHHVPHDKDAALMLQMFFLEQNRGLGVRLSSVL